MIIAVDLIVPPLTTLAYTAGLIDGGGSIQINPSKNRAVGKRWWSLTVQVSSNTDAVLEALAAEWGIGSVTYFRTRGSRVDRTAKNWRIYSAQAYWLLTQVRPFLRMKTEQADIALLFRQTVCPTKGRNKEWFTPERLARRTELALAMRAVNARNGKGNLAVAMAT